MAPKASWPHEPLRGTGYRSGVSARRLLIAAWLVLAGCAIDAYLAHRSWLQAHLAAAFARPPAIAWMLYMVCGALRGFTLIPSTTLVLVAIPFFPPGPLLLCTLAGIALSSSGLYFFSSALGLGALFETRHPAQVARVRSVLTRHEMPIIIGWSFFPLAPTDLICYVCGVLEVNFWKFIVGVTAGEGTICALYIFGGDQLLQWLHLR